MAAMPRARGHRADRLGDLGSSWTDGKRLSRQSSIAPICALGDLASPQVWHLRSMSLLSPETRGSSGTGLTLLQHHLKVQVTRQSSPPAKALNSPSISSDLWFNWDSPMIFFFSMIYLWMVVAFMAREHAISYVCFWLQLYLLPSCVTLGKFLNISDPPFPNLHTGCGHLCLDSRDPALLTPPHPHANLHLCSPTGLTQQNCHLVWFVLFPSTLRLSFGLAQYSFLAGCVEAGVILKREKLSWVWWFSL
jgi:hypothetical protein